DPAALRAKALDWLRAELEDSARTEKDRKETLAAWKKDADLTSVRETIDTLPEDERAGWRALWADVDHALARAPPRRCAGGGGRLRAPPDPPQPPRGPTLVAMTASGAQQSAGVLDVLRRFDVDPQLAGLVVAHRVLPPQEASCADLPEGLDPRL